MKRIVVALILCLVSAEGALAADVPQPAPVPPANYSINPLVPYDWGGFYLGVNGGYAFGNSTWSNPGPPPFSTGSFSLSGFLVGATLGVNYQMGPFVFGFEGDADYSRLKGTVAPASSYCISTALVPASCETAQDILATVRGRVGVAFDRLLFYGTAGGAFGNVQVGLNPPATFDSAFQFGWTAGAGVEFAFADNWTAKLEYLYIDLGSSNTCSTISGNCGLFFGTAGTTTSLTENLVRLGVNYKFGF